jgi:hypothetical protein
MAADAELIRMPRAKFTGLNYIYGFCECDGSGKVDWGWRKCGPDTGDAAYYSGWDLPVVIVHVEIRLICRVK